VFLGYLVKLQGWMPLLIDARDSFVTTMYDTLAEAFHGWSRSLVNGIWTTLGRGRGSIALLVVWPVWGFCGSAPGIVSCAGTALDRALLVIGILQILAGLAILCLRSGRWLPALGDTLAMPMACVLFLAIWGMGLVRAWRRGGTVWKGQEVRTVQRLPPWQLYPPRARSQG
jgi:hypothetical protein